MTWGEITPFCPVCRRCGSLARGISLPLFGEGSTCPTPLVPLRNLRETSRSAVRPGRLRRGPRTTRSVAAPACVVPHGGKESRQRGVAQALPVVPAASGASRSPPAAPGARGLQRRGAGPPDGDLLRARSGARGRSARDPGAAPRGWSGSGAGGAGARRAGTGAGEPGRRRGRAATAAVRDPGPGPGTDGRGGCRGAAAAGAARGRGAHRAVARRSGRCHRAACRAGHPARGDRPGSVRGRRRPRRGGAVPRAGRHRRAVDVRERPARRVQRAAGQRDTAGLPRPDVGAGDDRRGPCCGSGQVDQRRRPHPARAGRRRRGRGAGADRGGRGRPGRGGARRPQARRGSAYRRGRGAAAPAEPGRAARLPRPGGGRARRCPRGPAPGSGRCAPRRASSASRTGGAPRDRAASTARA